MGANTNIEWADHSWSPWRGCTKVSPGCANCYAETLSRRNPAVLGQWGRGKPRVLAKNWGDPVRWNKMHVESGGAHHGQPSPRVFPSLCDWLDEEVSPAWLADFMALVNLTPHLDWLLLTKRPENWRERIDAAALASTPFHQRWLVEWLKGNPPQNVWFGVSVEDQERAEERVPMLSKIPAVVRWLSVEPMLGPLDLRLVSRATGFPKHITADGRCIGLPGPIDWIVVGGESGPGARPCHTGWIRDIVLGAQRADVPVFVKQLGARAVESSMSTNEERELQLNHPKGGDPDEWPDAIRVRQFPNTQASDGANRS